jgi:hypothetical protein
MREDEWKDAVQGSDTTGAAQRKNVGSQKKIMAACLTFLQGEITKIP